MWDPNDSLDGGESLNDLRVRVRSALDTIQKQHASGSVLVVGHSYMNRMLLSVVFGLTIDQMRSFDQNNDELYLMSLSPASRLTFGNSLRNRTWRTSKTAVRGLRAEQQQAAVPETPAARDPHSDSVQDSIDSLLNRTPHGSNGTVHRVRANSLESGEFIAEFRLEQPASESRNYLG